MEALRESLRTSQAAFLKRNPDHGTHPDFKDEITEHDVETVLNYTINWGKYKGMTYKDILIRYPSYFTKTVMGFQKKHPESYTWRCFAKLFNIPDLRNLSNPSPSTPPKRKPSTTEPDLGPPLPLKRQKASH